MKSRIRAKLQTTRKRRSRPHYHAPGEAPGVFQPHPEDEVASVPALVGVIRYSEGEIEEYQPKALSELEPAGGEGQITWLHLQGSPTAVQLQALEKNFNLHPLALEDVFHREYRPKFENYDAHYFIVLDHLRREQGGTLHTDQVNFFLGKGFVVSIDEGPEDRFDPVRRRLRAKRSRFAIGPDYLLYALMDVVIDGGFPVLEQFGNRIEALEEAILDNPTRESRNGLHYLKRELVTMRRCLWPQREVISTLLRDDGQFLSDTTRLYMRDCYDHSVIMMDLVESYREMTTSLLDTYLSSVSQRMNDVMKALTIIATIFLPLSFVASLYGMNFNTDSPWNMPELNWRFGYFYILGVMLAVVLGMIAWFRHKRWL
ncbi:MAG: magnesium/cobalt transporter CorA [Gammaproteobacteria bacterium]|nr:magnesium/cobalt transporter CorA [Gammaproteobacteria bacterium]